VTALWLIVVRLPALRLTASAIVRRRVVVPDAIAPSV
jgi:hypothetical protein